MSRSSSIKQEPYSVDLLDAFEGGRESTGRAVTDALDRFHDDHLDGSDRLLEIGSGTGFLRRHWPSDAIEWLEMDIADDVLRESRRRQPGGEQLQGSVYDIPLQDGAVDTAAGYLSYTDFRDIDAAIAETWRVLEDGGQFIHFIDMIPGIDTLIDDVTEDGALPHWFYPADIDEVGGNLGYVPREEFDTARERFPDLIAGITETAREDHVDEVWSSYRRQIMRDLHGEYADDVRFDDYFQDRLVGALERVGASDIDAGRVTGTYRGERTPAQREMGRFRFYSGIDAGPVTDEEPGRTERALYRAARAVPGMDAARFEPEVVERVVLRYVTGRKQE